MGVIFISEVATSVVKDDTFGNIEWNGHKWDTEPIPLDIEGPFSAHFNFRMKTVKILKAGIEICTVSLRRGEALPVKRTEQLVIIDEVQVDAEVEKRIQGIVSQRSKRWRDRKTSWT